MQTSSDTRYAFTAKTLHWVSALLVLVLIGSGFRSGFAEDAATKAAALRVHLPVAGAVLLLTLGRLIWWWSYDRRPGPVPGVPDWQERAGRWTHRALYLALLVLLASGIAMSVQSDLPNALFGAASMPDLAALPPRTGHGIAARVIAALVVLHVLAALYHHVWLKDATLKRMWFGGI